MLPTSRFISQIEDAGTNGHAVSRISAAAKNDSSPAFVACFVLRAQQAETLISLLQEFVSSAECLAPATFSPLAIAPTNDSTCVWLTHPEAAKCLGISTTTLYRYVEQERIEFRKIGNRLEYRRSALEQFKAQHVRPARRPRRQEV
ncbi:MAG: helix-turn-helix domain-containing protein [Candidatus Acidiferrales bacterium]